MHDLASFSRRRLIHAALAPLAAVAIAGATPHAVAQDVDLGLNVDFSTWELMGDASVFSLNFPGIGTSSYLQLTAPGVGDQVGGAYAPAPLALDFNAPFQIRYWFYVVHGGVVQGDGMSFFMTGSAPTLGSGGSDLGYGGSGMNGWAFAVDTFNFDGEPQAVSVQILGDGDVTPIAYTETGLADIQPLDYFQWQAKVSYTPSGLEDETGALSFSIHQFVTDQTYTVTLDGVDWSSVAIDLYDGESNFLGRGIHIGFTAANGLADDGHILSSLTLAPIPEPHSWAMLLAGLGVVGQLARRRLRDGVGG